MIRQASRPCGWLTVTRFKSETVEESYSYFRDSIEYSLVRYYLVPTVATGPPGPDGGSSQPQPQPEPEPLDSLPAWDQLTPVDPAGKWILYVKTEVPEDNSPENMQKAQDELMAVREQLTGVFDFKVFDRRAHDTRIAQPVTNIPAPLPQVVRA